MNVDPGSQLINGGGRRVHLVGAISGDVRGNRCGCVAINPRAMSAHQGDRSRVSISLWSASNESLLREGYNDPEIDSVVSFGVVIGGV
jgi:hypothetical protein